MLTSRVSPLLRFIAFVIGFGIARARIGDGNAVDALIGALNDDYDAVRLNSIYALGRIGDGRAVEPLKEMLKDEDASI